MLQLRVVQGMGVLEVEITLVVYTARLARHCCRSGCSSLKLLGSMPQSSEHDMQTRLPLSGW